MSLKGFFKFLFTNIIVRNVLLVIAASGLLILGVLYWLDSYTLHNQAIVVPDVTGMQEEAAAPVLKSKKLRYQVIDSVYSRSAQPGAIVDQIPAAASKVKENRIVFLTVNAKNAQTVELPDVQEISQRQALASLRALGFKVDSVRYVTYEYRDLVVGVQYNDKIVTSGQRLPFGANLVLEVGDGNIEVPADSLDSAGVIEDSEKDWFE
ncbi:MAG: PASTA domain-containing protein [Bacteroidales bacterium]